MELADNVTVEAAARLIVTPLPSACVMLMVSPDPLVLVELNVNAPAVIIAEALKSAPLPKEIVTPEALNECISTSPSYLVAENVNAFSVESILFYEKYTETAPRVRDIAPEADMSTIFRP
jgi:hypothetical protein